MRTILNDEEQQWLNENEEYANQDCTKRHWRENIEAEIGRGKYLDAIETSSLKDMIGGVPEWMHEAAEQLLTPFGKICFQQYFVTGRTVDEIAKSMKLIYVIDDVPQEEKQVTFDMVHSEIYRIRKKMKKISACQLSLSPLINRKSS